MKIAVLGTDRRFDYLIRLLKDAGHEMITDAGDADITVTKWPAERNISGKLVTCGPEYAPEGAYDLLKDEEYQRKIARMTAEGAIAAAMGRTGCALEGAKCMIVGWGRIGRALAGMLVALGADVTVLSRREEVFSEIKGSGGKAEHTDDAARLIQQMRFVFSTPPAMVIDRRVLENARKDAVIIDLASPPYGVDVDAAAELGVPAWREPGVPGRYCPENAAGAIYESMRKWGLFDE